MASQSSKDNFIDDLAEENENNISNENEEERDDNEEVNKNDEESKLTEEIDENELKDENEELKEKEDEAKEDETIQIEYDKLKMNIPETTEIFEGKFNIITSVQTKIFDSKTYKPEGLLKTKNEKGEIEFKKIPLENYIRWKYEGEEENKKLICNAKIIELSDGSYQLVIGDQFIDIIVSNMNDVRFGYEAEDNISIVGQNIIKRMLLSQDKFQGLKKEKEENKSKIQVSYNFFDKTIFKKEEYGSKYSRRRLNKELRELEKEKLGKKRNRNES